LAFRADANRKYEVDTFSASAKPSPFQPISDECCARNSQLAAAPKPRKSHGCSRHATSCGFRDGSSEK
jgi:hypothetical protein